MIPLEPNWSRSKDNIIDNRRSRLLTNLAGPWMNRVGRGDSVKRGVGEQNANEQRKRQRITSHTVTIIKYCIIHVYIYIYIYYFMYYITTKVALPSLPVSGLGVHAIILYYFNSILCL